MTEKDLRATIEDASQRGEGVVLEPGTYVTTETVEVPDDVTIEGTTEVVEEERVVETASEEEEQGE